MGPFQYGHDRGADWRAIADSCLRQVGVPPAGSTLGFVYLTDRLVRDATAILDYLRGRTGVAHWVGCVGIGICATGQEYYDEAAMAVMLGEFPAESFRVFAMDELATGPGAVHADWLAAHRPWFGVVHGIPDNAALEVQLVALSKHVSSGFVTGGLASSEEVDLCIADSVQSGGLSGVLFTEAVPVSTRLSQGCLPIGPRHLVSESEANIIVRLDQRPALDVFKQDSGATSTSDLRRIGGNILVGLPVTGSDRNEYLVRNLMGIDPENGLLAIGAQVASGDPVLFCRRDPEAALVDLRRMLDDLLRAIDKRPIRGAIYVSCLGRGASLFGPESAELRVIEEKLGPVPLVGFYANGEISGNHVYGYTGVLTLFH